MLCLQNVSLARIAVVQKSIHIEARDFAAVSLKWGLIPVYIDHSAWLDGLKEGGKLVIVDFKPGDIPVGPPEEMRIAASKAVAELRQAGFGRVSVDHQTLPYQYILVAQ